MPKWTESVLKSCTNGPDHHVRSDGMGTIICDCPGGMYHGDCWAIQKVRAREYYEIVIGQRKAYPPEVPIASHLESLEQYRKWLHREQDAMIQYHKRRMAESEKPPEAWEVLHYEHFIGRHPRWMVQGSVRVTERSHVWKPKRGKGANRIAVISVGKHS